MYAVFLLVGFDGYSQSDIRHQEMINIFNLYNKHNMSVEIMSLTPTTYPVLRGSVYAPTKKV